MQHRPVYREPDFEMKSGFFMSGPLSFSRSGGGCRFVNKTKNGLNPVQYRNQAA